VLGLDAQACLVVCYSVHLAHRQGLRGRPQRSKPVNSAIYVLD